MVQRVCKKCEKVKEIEEFKKGNRRGTQYTRYICIECEKEQRKIYNKLYYQSKKNKVVKEKFYKNDTVNILCWLVKNWIPNKSKKMLIDGYDVDPHSADLYEEIKDVVKKTDHNEVWIIII